MRGLAEIIPIESRRGRRRRHTPPPQVSEPQLTPEARRRRLLAVCGGLGAVVLALVVINQTVIHHGTPPAPLAEETRVGLYQRAMDDVKASCALPQARNGVLRQHCVDQARFLQVLPDCTADCLAVTRTVLSGR